MNAPANLNSVLVNEQYIRCGLCLEKGAGLDADALKMYSRLSGLSNASSTRSDSFSSFSTSSYEFFCLLFLVLELLFWSIFKIKPPITLCTPFGIFTSKLSEEYDEFKRFFKKSLTIFSFKK